MSDDGRCPRTGKREFESPERAKRAAKIIRRRSDERMYPYRCEHCRTWHLGHRTAGPHKTRDGGERD